MEVSHTTDRGGFVVGVLQGSLILKKERAVISIIIAWFTVGIANLD